LPPFSTYLLLSDLLYRAKPLSSITVSVGNFLETVLNIYLFSYMDRWGGLRHMDHAPNAQPPVHIQEGLYVGEEPQHLCIYL